LYEEFSNPILISWHMEFKDIIRSISSGVDIDQTYITPYLTIDSREKRCEINLKLAQAFRDANNLSQANCFIQRAWLLSKFSEDLLPLFIDIHSSLGDIPSIQAAYKRIGIRKCSEPNFSEALYYFTLSIYAYANNQKIDFYTYDFDMLGQIDILARQHRFAHGSPKIMKQKQRIKLAYLLFGILQTGSTVVKICQLLAKHHDKNLFEVTFYLPETESSIKGCTESIANINKFISYECDVITAPEATTEEESLVALAKEIYSRQSDILITTAMIADLRQYFIASTQPAPVVIGLHHGPPAQFVVPSLDWSITWSRHPLVDCPCDCSLVPLEVELPKKKSIRPINRQSLDIPEHGLILMSAGRYTKFQEKKFWQAIFDLLEFHPNAYYVVLGVERQEVALIEELLTPSIEKRVKIISWQRDYLPYLAMADIFIDTYPSGGGLTLVDAMALAIPIVVFKNNFMQPFNQNDWSHAEDLVNIPELLIERNDYRSFKKLISKLMIDQEFYQRMSKAIQEQIYRTNGRPERMVKECERIYTKVFHHNSH